MVRLLDTNLDGDCRDSGELFWQLSDAQFSTVAVIDKNAVLQERVSYTSYGVGTHRWPHEVNNTGGVTTSGSTSDYGVINALAGANSGAGTPISDSSYNVAADLNRDGVIDSTDATLFTAMGGAKSALASGLISDPSGPDNVFGYDGYVYNADQGLYTVRFRWYSPTFGRYLQRDPVGDMASGLYAYVDGMPLRLIDPLGLYGVAGGDGDGLEQDLEQYLDRLERQYKGQYPGGRCARSALGEANMRKLENFFDTLDKASEALDEVTEFLGCMADCMIADGTYSKEVARALINQILNDQLSAIGSLGEIKLDEDWNLEVEIDHGNTMSLVSKLAGRAGREGRELGWLIYQGGKIEGCASTMNLGKTANRALGKLDKASGVLKRIAEGLDIGGKGNTFLTGVVGIANGAACASAKCEEKCEIEQAERRKSKNEPWYKFW